MAADGLGLMVPGWTPTYGKFVGADRRIKKGTLFLFAPGHTQGAFAGVPLTGKVPNVAWQTAASILGAGTADSLAFDVTGSANVAGKWLVERTAKGAVHGIITQDGSQIVDYGWTIQAASAIRDFMYLHRLDQEMFVSFWSRTTRTIITTSNAAPQSHYHYTNTSTAGSLFSFQTGSTSNGAVNRTGGRTTASDADVPTLGQPKINNMGLLGIAGTGPGAAQPVQAGVGNFSIFGSANRNKAPSKMLYEVLGEILTVTGRTYAEADAEDYAAWQAAFAEGGRYYGDTWTNPSTLP